MMPLINVATASCILVIPSSAGSIPVSGDGVFQNANDLILRKNLSIPEA